MLSPNAPSCRIKFRRTVDPGAKLEHGRRTEDLCGIRYEVVRANFGSRSAQRDRAPTRLNAVEQRITREQRQAVVQPVIDAHQHLIPIADVDERAEVVAARGRVGRRLRIHLQDVPGERRDAAGRNRVVRERVTYKPRAVRVGARRRRVENQPIAAETYRRKVAAPLRRCGHRDRHDAATVDPRALEVDEEERSAAAVIQPAEAYGPAESAAHLVVVERRLWRVGKALRQPARFHALVAMEPI